MDLAHCLSIFTWWILPWIICWLCLVTLNVGIPKKLPQSSFSSCIPKSLWKNPAHYFKASIYLQRGKRFGMLSTVNGFLARWIYIMIFICCVNCLLYEDISSHPCKATIPSSTKTNNLSLLSARELKQSLLITHRYGKEFSKQKRKVISLSKIQCLNSFLATWCKLSVASVNYIFSVFSLT